jgi:hypothetical protein
MLTDAQLLTIALASVPTVLAVLVGILVNNSRLSDLRAFMDARFEQVDRRFERVDLRFEQVDRRFEQVERRLDQLDRQIDLRFEEVKELWRSELQRVEEVLDARLKHLEDR